MSGNRPRPRHARLVASDAVAPLVRCLQASDVIVRVGALKALAKIGDTTAAPEIFEVASGDDSFGVRMEAALALGRLGDARSSGLICSMLWEERNPYGRRYRRWAAKRLVELGAIDAVPDLERARKGAGLIGRWHLKRAIKALKELKRAE